MRCRRAEPDNAKNTENPARPEVPTHTSRCAAKSPGRLYGYRHDLTLRGTVSRCHKKSTLQGQEIVKPDWEIVPKYWRPSADHVWGSVVGSDSFPTCRSRRQVFRSRCSRLTF